MAVSPYPAPTMTRTLFPGSAVSFLQRATTSSGTTLILTACLLAATVMLLAACNTFLSAPPLPNFF